MKKIYKIISLGLLIAIESPIFAAAGRSEEERQQALANMAQAQQTLQAQQAEQRALVAEKEELVRKLGECLFSCKGKDAACVLECLEREVLNK